VGPIDLGGCGASVTGPFEINIVAATRVWVSTSKDGSLGSWSSSLAVDDAAANKIVGMQLAPGALDNAGNVYVAYPESPNAYPNYDGAAIKIVHAPANLSKWSTPAVVAPAVKPGNILPHIVAGDPGKVDVAWFQAVDRPGKAPAWYAVAAQSQDALGASPSFTQSLLSNIATYTGTATSLMGACDTGPAQPANGFVCGRSTDVWGVALDSQCALNVTWPAISNDANASKGAGTYVAVQTAGPTVCGQGFAADTTTTPAAAPTPTAAPLPNTSEARSVSSVQASAFLGLLAAVLLGVALFRVRARHR
jgi:hypothetical protein